LRPAGVEFHQDEILGMQDRDTAAIHYHADCSDKCFALPALVRPQDIRSNVSQCRGQLDFQKQWDRIVEIADAPIGATVLMINEICQFVAQRKVSYRAWIAIG
jgi:hypothetical protein